MEISPTRAINAENCIRFAIEGADAPAGNAAMIGKFVHAAAERHALAVMAGTAEDKTPMSFIGGDELPSEIRSETLDVIARYQSKPEWLPEKEALLSVEASDSEDFHPTLGKRVYRSKLSDKHTLAGIPDRVSLDGEFLMVDDLKTGFVVPDDPIQLSAYFILASDKYGITKGRGRFLFPRMGFAPTFWYESFDIDYARARLAGIADKLEKHLADGTRPETICLKCVNCGVRTKCQAYAKVLANEAAKPPALPEDPDDLDKIRKDGKAVAKIWEGWADEAKNKLKGMIPEGGLVHKGQKYTTKETPGKYNYTAAGTVDVLKKFGAADMVSRVVEISGGEITKLLEDKEFKARMGKDFEAFEAAIKKLRSVAFTRLTLSKKPVGNAA